MKKSDAGLQVAGNPTTPAIPPRSKQHKKPVDPCRVGMPRKVPRYALHLRMNWKRGREKGIGISNGKEGGEWR
jgi:hypothetical protein